MQPDLEETKAASEQAAEKSQEAVSRVLELMELLQMTPGEMPGINHEQENLEKIAGTLENIQERLDSIENAVSEVRDIFRSASNS